MEINGGEGNVRREALAEAMIGAGWPESGSFARGTLSARGNNGTMLDQIVTSSRNIGFGLDALGNWASESGSISQTRSFNTKNQITAISGANVPIYDNNGNMTRDEKGQTYEYDAWNRMVNAVGSTELFAYDADNRRPSLTVCGPTVTDSYYSSDWQILQEGCGGTTATSQYVWGLGYIDDLVLRDDNSTSGSLGKTSSGLGRRLYSEQDANYDVTSITNASGAVQVRIQYDPYGVPTFLTSSWGTGGSLPSGWEPLFQGLRYDSTDKTYDGRSRIYDPALGVWMQQDRGYKDGSNLYQEDDSNPSSLCDPFGAKPETKPSEWRLQVNVGFDSSADPAKEKEWVEKMLAALLSAIRYCHSHGMLDKNIPLDVNSLDVTWDNNTKDKPAPPDEYTPKNNFDENLVNIEGPRYGLTFLITRRHLKQGDASLGGATSGSGSAIDDSAQLFDTVLAHEAGHQVGYNDCECADDNDKGHGGGGHNKDEHNLMYWKMRAHPQPDKCWCKLIGDKAWYQHIMSLK